MRLPDDLRFNSRAPRGARPAQSALMCLSSGFNSRAPRGARRPWPCASENFVQFQFTCPSRSTTFFPDIMSLNASVSIHVPLAEHDVTKLLAISPVVVSIHVPLAEHDQSWTAEVAAASGFNSRAPRGARPNAEKRTGQSFKVSIHVPLAEHDLPPYLSASCPFSFNSRAPRGARRP